MGDARETDRGHPGRRDGLAGPPERSDRALARIGAALEGLRYGSVLAIVQDGVVIQIERTEKTRIEKNR